jgi:Bacterial Ig domain
MRTGLTLAAAIAALALAAPSALADGFRFGVSKSPVASAGTVTGTQTVTSGRLPVTTPIIDCGRECVAEVEQFSSCTLCRPDTWPVLAFDARPADGWVLRDWEGCTPDRRTRACMGDEVQTPRGVTASFDDVAPPEVRLSAPPEGTAVAGRLDLTAAASDNWGVAQVEFQAQGATVAIDADGSDGYTATLDTTALADGPFRVVAVATDLAGRTTDAGVGLVAENVPDVPVATPTPTPTAAPTPVAVPPAPVPPAPLPAAPKSRAAVLATTLFYRFAAPGPLSTKLLELRLGALPKGSALDVRCRGGGCPKRRKTTVPKGGRLPLKAFAGHTLGKGAVVEIRVTRPDGAGKLWRLTIRSKRAPRFERRCLLDGDVVRCPSG